MKKSVKTIIALLLAFVLAFGLAACTSSNEPAPAEPTPSEGDGGGEEAGGIDVASVSGNFVMGTGGVSGTWYPVGGAICNAMSQGKMNVTVQSSGGGVENARTIIAGERDLGTIGADVAYYAYTSTNGFEGEDGSKLRAIARFAPAQAHLAVRANSDINVFTDVKGHNCGVGATGSGDELAFRNMLGAFDLDYDDIGESLISIAEQVTAFKDHQIETVWSVVSAPASGYLDLASQVDIRLIPFDGEIGDTLLEKFPFFYADVIPASAYSFLTEDVNTVAMDSLIVASTDLSNEQVYAMLDNLFSNIADVQATHNAVATWDAAFACGTGEYSIPIHEGAAMWYREHGYMD